MQVAIKQELSGIVRVQYSCLAQRVSLFLVAVMLVYISSLIDLCNARHIVALQRHDKMVLPRIFPARGV